MNPDEPTQAPDRYSRRWRAFEDALRAARELEAEGRIGDAWTQLERAHVIGQQPTLAHFRAHRDMLGLAWRTGDRAEILGQLLRLVGAVLVTWLWVPRGNPGRANVGAFRSRPVPPELAELLEGD